MFQITRVRGAKGKNPGLREPVQLVSSGENEDDLQTSLPVDHIQMKVLPASSHTTHDFLRRALLPLPRSSHRRQLARHDLPRQRIRERVLSSDLFSFLGCAPQRRIDAFNQQRMRQPIHDPGHLYIKRIFRVRRDIDKEGFPTSTCAATPLLTWSRRPRTRGRS